MTILHSKATRAGGAMIRAVIARPAEFNGQVGHAPRGKRRSVAAIPIVAADRQAVQLDAASQLGAHAS